MRILSIGLLVFLSGCTVPQVLDFKGFELDVGPAPEVNVTPTGEKKFRIQVKGRTGQEFQIVQQAFEETAESLCYKPSGFSGYSLSSQGGLKKIKGPFGVYGLSGEVKCR